MENHWSALNRGKDMIGLDLQGDLGGTRER